MKLHVSFYLLYFIQQDLIQIRAYQHLSSNRAVLSHQEFPEVTQLFLGRQLIISQLCLIYAGQVPLLHQIQPPLFFTTTLSNFSHFLHVPTVYNIPSLLKLLAFVVNHPQIFTQLPYPLVVSILTFIVDCLINHLELAYNSLFQLIQIANCPVLQLLQFRHHRFYLLPQSHPIVIVYQLLQPVHLIPYPPVDSQFHLIAPRYVTLFYKLDSLYQQIVSPIIDLHGSFFHPCHPASDASNSLLNPPQQFLPRNPLSLLCPKIAARYHSNQNKNPLINIIIQARRMSLSANKLQEFRVDIRKQSIASLIKKMRYEIVENDQKERLQALIAIPLETFTIQNLKELIQFVNLDESNAILHLGNLIIDRFINIQSLEKMQLKLGKNQYLTWLINAMAQIDYCTSQMFDYLVWRISIKKSSFNLENALQALQRCLKANPAHTLTYMDNKEELLLALVNHIHDPNDRISVLSLGLIVSATNYSEDLPLQMQKVVGQARLEEALLTASMKMSAQQRVLAIQAANNLLLSGVILQGIIKRVLMNSICQKQNVKLQLSFYYNAVIKQVSQNTLVELIQDYYFLHVLKDFVEQKTNKGKYGKQIRQNSIKAVRMMLERFRQRPRRQLIKDLKIVGLGEVIEEMVDQGTNNIKL